ncbi:MAG: M28 family peptidase [Myxacorys californica WJT36-NPBG1]|nr:M28 family peptidase [Myxacorys californica WJT36-NPBG1]
MIRSASKRFKQRLRLSLQIALATTFVSLSTACVSASNRVAEGISPIANAEAQESSGADATVQALVKLGPRVAGTPANEKASQYLIEEYRKAGYQTQVQPFTYAKFQDLGSSVTVGGTRFEGQALNGSIAGKLTAPLVAIPNAGRPADFANQPVKGRLAIVRRGEIPFTQKAENAAKAGAVGLIVVNNEAGTLRGTLTGTPTIPVVSLSREQGNDLIDRAQATPTTVNLTVNAERRTVTGRNIIAYLDGVTQPQVLVGGHYDSVAGSPGANDNASGTAVVLAMARRMANMPQARQAWFVAFDGEEDGLRGSRAFVEAAQPQFLSGLKAMLNFDMVGVNEQLQLGGSPSLTAISAAQIPGSTKSKSSIPQSVVNGGSDHASFAAKNVPVLFFYRGSDPNYHTPNDKVIDSKLLTETTQTATDIVQQILKLD